MALTEERKVSLLAYCKLLDMADDPEVQILIPIFYDAAVDYLADAGVSEPENGTTRRGKYELCVNRMVLDAWDRRDTTVTGTIVTENPVFRRMLNQLKLTEPVSTTDTGSEGRET